jgi:hypothetical protein
MKKVLYVDIDGTICTQEKDYSKAKPIQGNIDIVNRLYEKHTVVYWTARGTSTGIDWRELTVAQFKEWGVKYHELKFGKPQFDYIIDDKAINARSLKRCNKGGE